MPRYRYILKLSGSSLSAASRTPAALSGSLLRNSFSPFANSVSWEKDDTALMIIKTDKTAKRL